MDAPNRVAVASVENAHDQVADIKMTFPEMYPRGAAPSFEFLPTFESLNEETLNKSLELPFRL